MSANVAAPTRRKKLAQGKKRSAAALGQDSKNTSSPEGPKGAGISHSSRGFDAQGNALPVSAITENELPPGWRWLRVKEIGDVQLGRQRAPKHQNGANMRPYLRVANVFEDRIDLSDVLTMNFTPREFDTFALRANDILLNEGQSLHLVGRPALYRDELPGACFQNTLVRFRPGPDVDPKFALTIFRGYMHTGKFQKIARWTTNIAHLGAQRFAEMPFPLPPLPEQRRIVAEIEKQFTRLEAGVAALRRVQANLKRYRAAVLKAACEGQLVPTEAEWKNVPFKDLIGKIGQGWSPKCDLTRDALPDEWAIVTTTAVQSMKYVDKQGKPLPPNLEPRSHIEIKAGDFLMTRKGPRKRAGVACLVRSTRPKLMVCDTVYRFRCHESLVAPSYLEIALNSPNVVHAIDRQKAGINESGVSLTHDKLGSVLIPLPPLAEQTRIVAQVERRLSVVEDLETMMSANLQRATRLRQSILQEAFTGEL
jgi:type I restriction enzyme S subunit